MGGAAPGAGAAAVAVARRRQSGPGGGLGAAGRVPPGTSGGGGRPGTQRRAAARPRRGTARRTAAPVHPTGTPTRMADVRHENDPPERFPATVISRVIIHVNGPPGAGKTTFVERLLGAVDEWALAVRCRRDESLRYARESSSARAPEMLRYRAAGATEAGRLTLSSERK